MFQPWSSHRQQVEEPGSFAALPCAFPGLRAVLTKLLPLPWQVGRPRRRCAVAACLPDDNWCEAGSGAVELAAGLVSNYSLSRSASFSRASTTSLSRSSK